MSFDTQYPNRKDHRRSYRGSKAFDSSCRNHGGCPWCESGRKHPAMRRAPADADDQIKEALLDEGYEEIEELEEYVYTMDDWMEDWTYFEDWE